jgi:hypothetical protein
LFNLGAFFVRDAAPHLCKPQPSAALTAPRTGPAKAGPHLFNLGAFFVRDALPHLCKPQPSAAFSAPRTGPAKAGPHLFNLGAFFVRDALPHLCKPQPSAAFSAQGIERKYRKARRAGPPGLRNWSESPVFCGSPQKMRPNSKKESADNIMSE